MSLQDPPQQPQQDPPPRIKLVADDGADQRKNAEALKIGTIQTAKEAERGIIDIETLVQTNQDLIDTINEVMTIQSEGRAKRIEAEKTLYNMETELKKKLLSTNL